MCVKQNTYLTSTSTYQPDQSKSIICLPEDVNTEDVRQNKVDDAQYTVTVPIRYSTYGEKYQKNFKFARTSIRLKKKF